jgi:hypothetical protein
MIYQAGTITANGGVVNTVGGPQVQGQYGVGVAGLVSGTALALDVSEDGVNWTQGAECYALNSSQPQTSITANGPYFMESSALAYLQVRCTAFSSGTVTVTIFGVDTAGPTNVSATITAATGAGVSPANYYVVPATAGTYTIKSTPGVLYGVYSTGVSILGTVAIEDGSTVVLPTGLLGTVLGSAPFSAMFPGGVQFNTSIKVVTSGVSTSSVTILYR